MVVVPKGSGEVRICVDLKALNENVLRECYPIPVVDDTLAQLSGATVFFKLDANSGFWQVGHLDRSIDNSSSKPLSENAIICRTLPLKGVQERTALTFDQKIGRMFVNFDQILFPWKHGSNIHHHLWVRRL